MQGNHGNPYGNSIGRGGMAMPRYPGPEQQYLENDLMPVYQQEAQPLEMPVQNEFYNEVGFHPADIHNSARPVDIKFDEHEELIWASNSEGRVTSYYYDGGQSESGMQRYTAFRVDMHEPVLRMNTHDNGLLLLTSDKIHGYIRRGLRQFQYRSESLENLQCMLPFGSNSVLLGGQMPNIVELDYAQRVETRIAPLEEGATCPVMKASSRYVVSGEASGKVKLRDPNTLRAEHTLSVYSGLLADLDVHGNTLVSCGFAPRQGSLVAERYLKVYDLRMLRSLPPIAVQFDPVFVRFTPLYSERLLVVSQSGQLQVFEGGMPVSPILSSPSAAGVCVSFDVSSTYQAACIGCMHEIGGMLHLFMSGSDSTINRHSRATEFPDSEMTMLGISLDDQNWPLSTIPMYYPPKGTLLSDWPENLTKVVYRKPKPIDPTILNNMKMNQNVGYATNTTGFMHNVVPYDIGKGRGATSTVSKPFKPGSVPPESPIGRTEDPFMKVPKKYRKVEIKYSKLGLTDFDFRHYNKTNYAGLEPHIPNAYCNSMLQVLYFIEPLRIAMLSHLCKKENCLACELGFLFYMLDTQKGKTCQASNFLRAFRTIPEVTALGLLLSETDESNGRANYPRLIQGCQLFVLQQLHSECGDCNESDGTLEAAAQQARGSRRRTQWSIGNADSQDAVDDPVSHSTPDIVEESIEEERSEEPQDAPDLAVFNTMKPSETTDEFKESVVSRLFGMKAVNILKCKCGEERNKDVCLFMHRLQNSEVGGDHGEEVPFCSLVQRSICQDTHTQAWCNKCNRYQTHLQSRSIQALPEVLILNSNIEGQSDREFWKRQLDIIKKVNEAKSSAEPATVNMNVPPCRYGSKCHRKGCTFRHDPPKPGEIKASQSLEPSESDIQYLPTVMRGRIVNGKLQLEQGRLPRNSADADQWTTWELHASVCHILEPQAHAQHLVAHIHAVEPYHKRKEGITCRQWYLFNDFAIQDIQSFEPLHLDMEWKVPCVLYYVREDLLSRHKATVTNPITSSVLFDESSVSKNRRQSMSFVPLDEEELPGRGDIVGLDAEFVTLNQEETELRCDGARSVIKPPQLSLARVTVVRGFGDRKGEPFIDDYIATKEQVVDYVTRFSGIKPQDLDATMTTKHLTTLKTTYLKLRYLADIGVKFCGHGLMKDFRVINMIVPATQIIDTVELFHQFKKRYISLKFLAHYYLDLEIQAETHDSAEDAQTALKLMQKFNKLKEQGPEALSKSLQELYDRGRQLKWKLPDYEDDADLDFDFLNEPLDGEDIK